MSVSFSPEFLFRASQNTKSDLSGSKTKSNFINMFFCRFEGEVLLYSNGTGSIHINGASISPNALVFVSHMDFSETGNFDCFEMNNGFKLEYIKGFGFKLYMPVSNNNNQMVVLYDIVSFITGMHYLSLCVRDNHLHLYIDNRKIFTGKYEQAFSLLGTEVKMFRNYKGRISEISLFKGEMTEEEMLAVSNMSDVVFTQSVQVEEEPVTQLKERWENIDALVSQTNIENSAVPSRYDRFDEESETSSSNQSVRHGGFEIKRKRKLAGVLSSVDNYFPDFEKVHSITAYTTGSQLPLYLDAALQDNYVVVKGDKVYFKREDFYGKIRYCFGNLKTVYVEKVVLQNEDEKIFHQLEHFPRLDAEIKIVALDYNHRLVPFMIFDESKEIIPVIIDYKNQVVTSEAKLYFYSKEDKDNDFISLFQDYNIHISSAPDVMEVDVLHYNGTDGIIRIIPKDHLLRKMIYYTTVTMDNEPLIVEKETSEWITYSFKKNVEIEQRNILKNTDFRKIKNSYIGKSINGIVIYKIGYEELENTMLTNGDYFYAKPKPIIFNVIYNEIEHQYTYEPERDMIFESINRFHASDSKILKFLSK